MATAASHSHSSSRTSYSRPKLLRSSVTAPTLVTSYASRNEQSSPDFAATGQYSISPDKATAVLNRIASYSHGYSEKSEERRKQVASVDKRIASVSPGSRSEPGERNGGGKNKKAKRAMQVKSDGKETSASHALLLTPGNLQAHILAFQVSRSLKRRAAVIETESSGGILIDDRSQAHRRPGWNHLTLYCLNGSNYGA